MAVNIPALVSVIVFYIFILVVGIIAGRKSARSSSSHEIYLANRNIGMFVSFFTLTATMVGGGYINGTAEMMAMGGLAMTTAPFGFTLSLFISGLLYAPKMRRSNYVTMFDPFQIKYGRRVGGLLFFPQLCGDLFWTAAILSALGTTVGIILDISDTVAIIVSACVAVFYTFLGGLLSVAYTDVLQLVCITVGLFLAFPFAMHHPSVDMSRVSSTWLGEIDVSNLGSYIDVCVMVVFGGIPWQTYYQRVLACKNAEGARLSSIMAAAFCMVLAIPPAMIGLIGAAADWNQTSYDGPIPLPESKYNVILPMVLNYLCPLPVAVIGIGAVAAAVMSSADSCVLSTGTVFAKNIYTDIFRRKASDREQIWVLRITILIVGVVGTALAITAKSIYGLFVLCADLMYVILFPQLTCVLWFAPSNTYGCLVGYLVSLVFRILSGEVFLGIPVILKFPMYDETLGQRFPFRTTTMLISFATITGVSLLTNCLFNRGIVPLKYDIFKCIEKETERRRQLQRGESILAKGCDDIVSIPHINAAVEKRAPLVYLSDDL
ncbi:high-affinity choline transporter 1-like [Gigantopelta aegis]|uniref:high-affinity choline transporter 1-like n=1 Tax=Gigantopelta aegis TaxID=1735272 RepID=UPI001B88B482|nr:high-affinity choline transporter 1-like [Gigantopelta aegis]